MLDGTKKGLNGTVSKDVCTTTTPRGRLLHHVSSGSVRVALRRVCKRVREKEIPMSK